jgi:hypothetical protein
MRIFAAGTALILCAVATPAFAQEPTQPAPRSADGVSVGLGGGVGSHDMAGVLALGVHTSVGDFVVRTAGTSEFTIFTEPESVGDFAVMYGRRATGARGWVRGAAGPGIVQSLQRGATTSCGWFGCSHQMIESSSVGLAAQVDAVWAITTAFGVGVTAFGNANGMASFTGLTLGVYFGKLR